MAKASPLTYEGALTLLGAHSPFAIEVLNRVAGGGILLGAIVVPDALGLVDGKQEAGRLVQQLTTAATARLHGIHGYGRHELLAAAHTTVVLSALFDALHETIGPSFKQLKVTDREKLQLVSGPGKVVTQTDWIGQLAGADLPLPGPASGFEENLRAVLAPRIAELAGSAIAFFEGLRVWKSFRLDSSTLVARSTEAWRRRYRDAYLRLASDVPEFFVWASLGEHTATREELRTANARLLEVLDRTSAALGQLHDILAAGHVPARPGRVSIRGKLARAATAVLDQPLLRSSALPAGLSFPTVAEGFVTPRFRCAVVSPTTGAGLSREDWWTSRPVQEGLDRFLAAYLSHPGAALRPLIMLGHPGAGKSLLTEILAARLPSEKFTVVPVQLRRVNADDRLVPQVESALREILKEQVSWGQMADENEDLTRVVILDGLDELIQATGTAQSAYLTDAARFQQEEMALGRPVSVVVTSRTVVVDRARVPDGAMVIKLEDFDDDRVNSWLTAWNRANVATPGFRALMPAEVLRHGDLARQPLLLTLLAIYHADPTAARLDDDTVSPAALYRMLLDNFIHRQVSDKPDRPPSPEQLPRLLGELRQRLSIAAFGMFNRQRQHVTEADLERDLEVFLGRDDNHAHGFESPASRAHRTVAGFFFVHVSRVDEYSEDPRRTYEFLHATFGEFLIAERALLLLDGYSRRLAEHRTDPAYHEAPDDSLLRALLSYQPLTLRKPIIEFASALASQMESTRREEQLEALRRLLATARTRAFGRYQRYEPTPPDVVTACATWTANLVVLACLIDAGSGDPSRLPPPGASPNHWWDATVRLWQAGLAEEGRKSLDSVIYSQSQGRGTSPDS